MCRNTLRYSDLPGFRGRILNRFYRQKHDFNYYAGLREFNWQKVIDKAGYANPQETRRILALAPAAYTRTAIDYNNDKSSDECGSE